MSLNLEKYHTHYHAVISLGIPIVIGQTSTIVIGFVDTIMIGRHSTLELAAAGFINNIIAVLLIFAIGFSGGITPLVGYRYGRGEKEGIGGIVKNCLASNSLLAIVLFVVSCVIYFCLGYLGQPGELLQYMRPYLAVLTLTIPFACWFNVFKQYFDAIGETKVPMIVLMGGLVINIVGNYLLIYGLQMCGMEIVPEMGLLGAGIATLIARIAMAVAIIWMFFRLKSNKPFCCGFLRYKVNKRDFCLVTSLSWPLAMQTGMESASFMLTVVFVGWIGSIPLAAHQVMLTISTLYYMIYCGLAAAVAVRVSHYHGQCDKEAAELSVWAGFHIIVLVAILLSVPMWLFRHDIGYLFVDDAEVCGLVASCIPFLILYQFADGMQCTFGNALRGLACVKVMMVVSFIAYFVVSFPLSYVFAFPCRLGLMGIWAAFPISLVIAATLYCTAFSHYKKKLFRIKQV